MSQLPVLAVLVLGVLMSVCPTNLNAQLAVRTIQPDSATPDSPVPDLRTAMSSISDPVRGSAGTLPENLPNNPRPHRVVDKKFVAVMGALGAAESMRFPSRQLVLENEMSAGAPWVTTVPSHTHLVLKYAPIFGAELLVAYAIKQPHEWLPGDRVIRKLWWLYPAAMAAVHFHNALGNIHTQGPGGCTSAAQCQQP